MTARNKTLLLCGAAASLILLSASPIMAQDAAPPAPAVAEAPASGAMTHDLMPPQAASIPEYDLSPDEDTHPLLRLTPDKSAVVRLDGEARSVIVGNPTHLSVLVDNAHTLVLVPHQPGATQFTVLDRTGKIIMQRHVIVASPQTQYVRIRRACGASNSNCNDTSVYYCPDMCHEVSINTDLGNGTSGLNALPTAAAASPTTTGEGTVDTEVGSDAAGSSPTTDPSEAIDDAIQQLQDQIQEKLQNPLGLGNN